MPPVQRIYMTGFMGVGKSSVTPRVAKRLGFSSVDLDDGIVQHLGMSVPGIFEVLGEPIFRETEWKLLQECATRPSVVVSLGGGTLGNPDALKLCLETGLLIYLRAAPESLARRLSRSRHTRPKLFGPDGTMLKGQALEDRVRLLLEERKSVYEKAKIVIDVDGLSAFQITEKVLSAIKRGSA